MTAVVRYQLAVLGHSQRYLPPALAYLALLAILLGDSPGPPEPVLAVSAGALLPIGCWLAIALADAEEPAQRQVTLAHAGSRGRLTAGIAAAAVLGCGGMAAAAMAWAAVSHGGYPAGALGVGALAHLACGCTGTAVGLASSRLLFAHRAATAAVALPATAVALLVPGIPLVHPMLRALATDRPATALAWLGAAASGALLAVAVAGVTAVSAHRA
jgi:hypothetical protein